MKKFLALFSLLFLLVGCDPKEKKTFSYPMETESSHPVLEVKTENGDSVGLLIDTGSDFTVINEFYYDINRDMFKLKYNDKLTIITINGEKDMYIPVVKTTFNDSVEATLHVMDILPLSQTLTKRNKINIVGILGSDFFNEKDAILNFNNDTIYIQENVKLK